MTRRRWLVAFCCLAWAASIFATSSTAVSLRAFLEWFRDDVFQDEAAFLKFQRLWGVSWYLIVKSWHVTEFGILMLLGTWAIDVLTARRHIGNVLAAAALCLAYAASDEWHQSFIPKRDGLISDVLIDSLGIILAGLYLFSGRRRPGS